MRPERPPRSGTTEPPGIRRELGAIGMTIDPGAKQHVAAWTSFTQSSDIPDWISKAYIDTYRGPDDDAAHDSDVLAPEPTSLVTPPMLGAHYRLGERRPPGESCVCVH